MSHAVNLDKTIDSLRKCYVGLEEDKHVLDKSKIDELTWIFASHRVFNAIKYGELTEKEFIKRLTKK